MPSEDQGNPAAVLEESLAVFCSSWCQENQRSGTSSWDVVGGWSFIMMLGGCSQAHPLQEMAGLSSLSSPWETEVLGTEQCISGCVILGQSCS